MRTTIFILSSLMSIAACDTAAQGPTTNAAPAADKAAAKSDGPAAKTDGAAAKADVPAAPVTMIEHDLSSQKGWEGWRAKGPDYAKVMSELHQGVRIAGGGSRLDKEKKAKFDLAFFPAKRDFAPVKDGIHKGVAAAAADANAKVTFTTDTPELLEWTHESHGRTSYNFLWNFQAGGKDVACGTNGSVGLESPESIAMHKEACKSLTKA